MLFWEKTTHPENVSRLLKECPLYLYKHQKVISVKIALEGYKIHATTFCDENVFPTWQLSYVAPSIGYLIST